MRKRKIVSLLMASTMVMSFAAGCGNSSSTSDKADAGSKASSGDKKGDITLSFVGDISLADNFDIMPYYDSRNEGVYGILSKEVVDIMTSSDIMVANNEFTISTRGTPLNKTYTFRADPQRLNIYKEKHQK